MANLIDASGLKRTTVFRLMAALEAEGIIRKLPTGNYMLGSGLIVLGGRAIRANRLRTVAQPFLHELAYLTTESVTIDVLWVENHQPESMVIEEMLGHHLLGIPIYRRPFSGTRHLNRQSAVGVSIGRKTKHA